MAKKNKEICPNCGRSFVYLSRHKCKAKSLAKLFNIAVTPKQYDDMGTVLKEMGYAYTDYKKEDLSEEFNFEELDILFMNCGGTPNPSAKTKRILKNFVKSGGALYVSDWADKWIKALFPEIANFHVEGPEGVINAQVVDFDLIEFLDTSEIQLNYDLGSWHGITEIKKKDGVRVYLRGDVPRRTKEPLLITFQYEKGFVIFTTFHNEKQVSEIEQRLLEFLVIKPLMHNTQAESLELLKENQFNPIKELVDALEINSDSQLYSFWVKDNRDLKFIFNWKGDASIKVSIFNPNDKTMHEEEITQSPYEIDISGATKGTWKFKIKIIAAPLKRFPITVNVGEKTIET